MRYLMLIYSDPSAGPTTGSAEQQAEHQEWFAYTTALAEAGHLVAGEALQAADTASTVRVRSGERLTTDGPFAETREVLGGFYLIEADDLDEALGWAAKMPNIDYGSVEVRPVMSFD